MRLLRMRRPLPVKARSSRGALPFELQSRWKSAIALLALAAEAEIEARAELADAQARFAMEQAKAARAAAALPQRPIQRFGLADKEIHESMSDSADDAVAPSPEQYY